MCLENVPDTSCLFTPEALQEITGVEALRPHRINRKITGGTPAAEGILCHPGGHSRKKTERPTDAALIPVHPRNLG